MNKYCLLLSTLGAADVSASVCYQNDINHSCSVDEADVTSMLDCLLTQDCSAYCDTNLNGTCNLSDLVVLLNVINSGGCEGFTSCESCVDWAWWDGGSALMGPGVPPWVVLYSYEYDVYGGTPTEVNSSLGPISVNGITCYNNFCFTIPWIDCNHFGCQCSICAWVTY